MVLCSAYAGFNIMNILTNGEDHNRFLVHYQPTLGKPTLHKLDSDVVLAIRAGVLLPIQLKDLQVFTIIRVIFQLCDEIPYNYAVVRPYFLRYNTTLPHISFLPTTQFKESREYSTEVEETCSALAFVMDLNERWNERKDYHSRIERGYQFLFLVSTSWTPNPSLLPSVSTSPDSPPSFTYSYSETDLIGEFLIYAGGYYLKMAHQFLPDRASNDVDSIEEEALVICYVNNIVFVEVLELKEDQCTL
ncbi:hypothetical protein SSX86_001964 [Deinandra increscens subsp. villosa]|uniref:Uncharacterized protein n=1 Tax=Deinandra increscens subsp. villosa TaxID=3103831 RepID=A0AAP0HAT9_9ASTR